MASSDATGLPDFDDVRAAAARLSGHARRTPLLAGTPLDEPFAIVIGELTIALYMAQKTLGPYMAELTRSKVYEPSAMASVAFAITWAAMGLIAFISTGRRKK